MGGGSELGPSPWLPLLSPEGISHQTLASRDGPAVLAVMDCRSAEPQIDARARPSRLAATPQLY